MVHTHAAQQQLLCSHLPPEAMRRSFNQAQSGEIAPAARSHAEAIQSDAIRGDRTCRPKPCEGHSIRRNQTQSEAYQLWKRALLRPNALEARVKEGAHLGALGHATQLMESAREPKGDLIAACLLRRRRPPLVMRINQGQSVAIIAACL